MPSPIQQRLLDLAADIAVVPPEELTFQHAILKQTSLPASRPPGMTNLLRDQASRY